MLKFKVPSPESGGDFFVWKDGGQLNVSFSSLAGGIFMWVPDSLVGIIWGFTPINHV